jgi:hypothetical protein
MSCLTIINKLSMAMRKYPLVAVRTTQAAPPIDAPRALPIILPANS